MLVARLAVVLLFASGPAFAHAILMESSPAARSTVAAGVVHLVLRFNSRIDQARSRLELLGASPARLQLGTASTPDTLQADVRLEPGAWVVRWQVLAVDGHITRGDVPLTAEAR